MIVPGARVGFLGRWVGVTPNQIRSSINNGDFRGE